MAANTKNHEAGAQSKRVLQKVKIRKNNILQILRKRNELTATDIARKTKYLISSVMKMLQELIQEGYVLESGIGESSGGRKPLLYKLNAEAAYFLGIDFGRANIRAVLVNLAGKVVYQQTARIYSEISKDELLVHFLILDEICSKLKIDIKRIKGIGLTVPERTETDSFNRIYPFKIRSLEITNLLKNKYHLPVYVLSDPQALILGEKYFGAWPRFKNVIAINAGYSIEMGIMIKGELYTGVNYHAGEIGHVKVPGCTELCYCGRTGCLRTIASSVGVVAQVNKRLAKGEISPISKNSPINGKLVNEYAEKGDDLCFDVLNSAGQHIGNTIAMAINLFNPELVILSGKMATSSKIVLATIKDSISLGTHPKVAMDMSLEISGLGEYAGALGVTTLPLLDMFDHYPEELVQFIY